MFKNAIKMQTAPLDAALSDTAPLLVSVNEERLKMTIAMTSQNARITHARQIDASQKIQ